MQSTLSRNMEKLDRLYTLAAKNNIPIDEECPDNIMSMSVRLSNGDKIIALSNSRQAEHTRLEQMAHELGHCMTDSFYRGYSPFELRAKHESKANKWAIEYLIPFSDLCDAVAKGYRELWELADYFNVSCQFVEKAIQIYERNGLTVPLELYVE